MTEISEMGDKNRKLGEVSGSIGKKMMYTRKQREKGNLYKRMVCK